MPFNPIKLVQGIQKARKDPSITDSDIIEGVAQYIQQAKASPTQASIQEVPQVDAEQQKSAESAGRTIQDVVRSVPRGVAQGALNISELGQSGLEKILGGLTGSSKLSSTPRLSEIPQVKKALEPETEAGHVTKFLSELLVGTKGLGAISKGMKALKSTPALADLLSKAGKAGKVGTFAAESAATTTALTGLTEGKLPSKEELAGFGLFDVGLAAFGKLGKMIYNSAFSPDKKMAAKLLDFKTTGAQLVREAGQPVGTASSIYQEKKKELSTLWQRLVDSAKEGRAVSRNEFLSIKDKMLDQFKDLPDSLAKNQIKDTIEGVLNLHAPVKTVEPVGIVAILKNINRDLFTPAGVPVLSKKQIVDMEKVMKDELKKNLPEATRGLYTEYAKMQDIVQIMKSETVRKIMGRTLAGAGIGAVTGAIASGVTQQDFVKAIEYSLLFLTLGAAGVKLLNSTLLKTYGGKGLEQVGKPPTQSLLKTLLQKATSQQQ